MLEKFKKIAKDPKGQFTQDVGNIVALLIVIAIGALVLYSITGAVDYEENTHTDNVITNVEEKGGTAFNLMTILAIVVVAAVIIGVVMRAIGGMGQQQAAPAPAR